MKTLVVYDSVHGNTEKIARAIGAAIGSEVQVSRTGDVNVAELGTFDLVVLGAPTYGGRPTPAMREFLARVPASALQGKKAASFDTRIPATWVKMFGFAAGKIAGNLKKAGATVLGSEGFFVKDTKGPLVDGELERAAAVAQQWVNWVKWQK